MSIEYRHCNASFHIHTVLAYKLTVNRKCSVCWLVYMYIYIYILYAKKPTENKDRELERRGESESWIGDIKSTTERERALHWHMHTVCYSSFFSLYFFIFSSLYHWNGAQQGYKLNNLILWLWHFEPLASAISLDSIESYAYITTCSTTYTCMEICVHK